MPLFPNILVLISCPQLLGYVPRIAYAPAARLLHLHSMVKMQPFYPVFPLAESIAETFYWLPFWSLKKSIGHFLLHGLAYMAILSSRDPIDGPDDRPPQGFQLWNVHRHGWISSTEGTTMRPERGFLMLSTGVVMTASTSDFSKQRSESTTSQSISFSALQ